MLRGLIAGVAMLAAVLALVGSRKKDRVKIEYPGQVTGWVYFDGRPLDGGTITFLPNRSEENGGRAGVARIETDGAFFVGNANPDKPIGLQPGDYKVAVLKMSLEGSESTSGSIRLSTPAIYADIKTSPLVATVHRGANRLVVNLASQQAE